VSVLLCLYVPKGYPRSVRRTFSLLVLLAACGPQKSSTGDESSTGNETSSATDPTSTPTGSASETPTTGEPLSCDAFSPPPPDAFKSVEITIVSKLAVPVWIGALGCGGLPAFRILDAGSIDRFGGASECSPTQCHEFLGAEDCSPGCNDCGSASARRIGPGSSFAINWSAAVGVPMQMTAACAPGTNCQRECLRPEPVAAGTYSVELTGFRQCTGNCECDDLDPAASCSLFAPIEMTEPFEVKVSLVYPETGAALLVLE